MDHNREAIEAAYENKHAATTVHMASLWLADHPDDLAAICWYVDMLYQMTRFDEAVAILKSAIDRFEANFPRHCLYSKMGALERYRGNFSEAEMWYRRAIKKQPDSAYGYVFLGAVQARQGRLKEAEATHREGTQCTEGAVDEAFHNLGLVLRGQGRLEEAANCFRAAIELDPEYQPAIEALADVETALRLVSKHFRI